MFDLKKCLANELLIASTILATAICTRFYKTT